MKRIATIIVTLATLAAGPVALAENPNRGVKPQPVQATNCMTPCAMDNGHTHQGLKDLEKAQ